MNIKDIQDLAKSYSDVLEKVQVANRKQAETNMDPVGQADADIDNDGDVDKSDKYLHNRRKSIKKAMKKSGKDDPESTSGETATMNPKASNGDRAEQKESLNSADKKPEDYVGPDGKTKTRMVPMDREVIKKESTDMSIRDKLLSVVERNNDHYKSAAEAEPMDNNLKGAGARKMKADIDGNTVTIDLEKQSHDDASEAGRVTKAAGANPTDKNNTKGDSKVVKPVADVTKSGKGDPVVKETSFDGAWARSKKTVHSIAAAYQSMKENK